MRQSWRLLGFGAVLAAVLAFTPGDLLGQKKNKASLKDPDNPATDADYAQIKNKKDMTGTIVTIDTASMTLTIRVDVPHQEPNPNYRPPKYAAGTQQAKLQIQMMKLNQDLMQAQNASPRVRQQAMNRVQMDIIKLQQQMTVAGMSTAAANSDPSNQPYMTVSDKKDYTLDIQNKVVVRKMFLPLEYDDEGKIKKYTDKEKEQLKGKDKSKPGYEAKLDDAVATQEIKIYLTPADPKKKKEADKAKAKAKDDDKAKAKDDDKEKAKDAELEKAKANDEKAKDDNEKAKDDNAKDDKAKDKAKDDAAVSPSSSPPTPTYPDRPSINMIVLLKEVPVAPVTDTPKKKKKKNDN